MKPVLRILRESAAWRGAFLAVVLIVATGCGSTPVKNQAARPSGPEDGGAANGFFRNGDESTPLRHAYAVYTPRRRATPEQVHLIFSDRRISREALDDLRQIPSLGREGEVTAIEIVVSLDGSVVQTHFHHESLPSGLTVTGALANFRISGLSGETVSGAFVFDEPGQYSWSARATFETPVYRPVQPPAPEVDQHASPADRARAELAAGDIPWSEKEFLDRCFHGDSAVVVLFLEGGMPATTRSGRGSALEDALSQKHLEIVKVLLAAGADPNEKVDTYGTTLLHHAVDTGDAGFVEALLARGADPGPANQYRITPLMMSSLEGRVEMVKLLIARGAKVTARDTSGGTALSCAVLRGHLEVARLLVAAGADVARDRKMLLGFARDAKNKELEKLVRDAGAGKGGRK